MKTLQFQKHVQGGPEEIFALIADFANYHQWLSRSQSFGTIKEISPDPVCLGTTYVDAGPTGVRRGTITAFEPPSIIAFRQPMTMKGVPGGIDIEVRYDLVPEGSGTHVRRDLSFAIRGPLKLLQPLVEKGFREENDRVLNALKLRIESGASAAPAT